MHPTYACELVPDIEQLHPSELKLLAYLHYLIHIKSVVTLTPPRVFLIIFLYITYWSLT